MDPDFYKNLGWLLENNVEDLMDETFTADVDYFGHKDTIELKPGGKDIKLTEANKREYVDLKAQHSMTTAISEQLKAFLGGFRDIIPKVHLPPPSPHTQTGSWGEIFLGKASNHTLPLWITRQTFNFNVRV